MGKNDEGGWVGEEDGFSMAEAVAFCVCFSFPFLFPFRFPFSFPFRRPWWVSYVYSIEGRCYSGRVNIIDTRVPKRKF